jgi:hypothetical protein
MDMRFFQIQMAAIVAAMAVAGTATAAPCGAGFTSTTPGSGFPRDPAWSCSRDLSARVDLPIGGHDPDLATRSRIIQAMPDGGAVLGVLRDARTIGGETEIIRIDAGGRIVWRLALPYLTGIDVNRRGDIAAAQTDYQQTATVSLIHPDGTIAWSHTYTPESIGFHGDRFAYVVIDDAGAVTLGGSYVGTLHLGSEDLVAGPTLDCKMSAPCEAAAFYLVHLDNAGALRWSRSYGDDPRNTNPFNRNRLAFGLAKAPGGDVLLYGRYLGKLAVTALGALDSGGFYSSVYLRVDDAGRASAFLAPAFDGWGDMYGTAAPFAVTQALDGGIYLNDWMATGTQMIQRNGTLAFDFMSFSDGARQLVPRFDSGVTAIGWGRQRDPRAPRSNFVFHLTGGSAPRVSWIHESPINEVPLSATETASGALLVLVQDLDPAHVLADGSAPYRLLTL